MQYFQYTSHTYGYPGKCWWVKVCWCMNKQYSRKAWIVSYASMKDVHAMTTNNTLQPALTSHIQDRPHSGNDSCVFAIVSSPPDVDLHHGRSYYSTYGH